MITETNSLPSICGRVCPQETQCESQCVRGLKGEPVGIGRLERFVADYRRTHGGTAAASPEKNGRRGAVIGAGPAGLTCAGDLAKLGYDVTVFEAFHAPGGVLVYGIPEFRLPKDIVAEEIRSLEEAGVHMMTDMVMGRVLSLDELMQMGFEAVFIGTGAGLPMFMGIEGESLLGVYSANEYLTRINLMKAYQPGAATPIYRGSQVVVVGGGNVAMDATPIKGGRVVAVVGGGNVAMDAARCAKRLGAEKVYIVYRRSAEEMPARMEEVHHAKEEGIEFRFLTNPTRILGDENGRVVGMECIEMELGAPDESGRRRPIKKEGSEFVLDLDTVIIAIGTTPNPLIRSTTKGLETNRKGCFVVDDSMATTREGVYAGGDAVTGAATVIKAMGAGKAAAKAMDEYIQNK